VTTSRSHTLIRNTLWNFASQGWFLLLVFFTTPYIVRKLGPDAYGVFSIVGVVIGYFAFLDLGLGQAVVKYVSEYYVQKDFKTIREIIGTAMAVYFLMGFIGAVLIAFLTGLLVTRVLKIPPGLINTTVFVFYISALGFFINMPLNVFGSIPRALQRFDITNKISIALGTLQLFLTVFLLRLGYFLQQIVVMNLLISFLSISIYVLVSRQLLPEVYIKPAFNKTMFGKLFKFGGFVAISSATVQISTQLNKFIIGIFLPISYLTYYAVPYGLASKVGIIPGSVSTAIFPVFSELDSMNRRDSLKELYLRTTKYIVIATIPIIILLIIFAQKFLCFWIGSEFAQKSTLPLQIITAGTLLSCWAYAAVSGSQGLNRPDIPAKFQVAEACLNTGLCFLLIPRWGIVGAALAWSSYRFIEIPLMIYIVSHFLFKISLKQLFNYSFLKPLVVGVGIVTLSYFVIPLINSLPSLILIFLFLSGLYFSIIYFFALENTDKKLVLHYVKFAVSLGRAR
jgi:O-antigen/teichoic acid export membrane protein